MSAIHCDRNHQPPGGFRIPQPILYRCQAYDAGNRSSIGGLCNNFERNDSRKTGITKKIVPMSLFWNEHSHQQQHQQHQQRQQQHLLNTTFNSLPVLDGEDLITVFTDDLDTNLISSSSSTNSNNITTIVSSSKYLVDKQSKSLASPSSGSSSSSTSSHKESKQDKAKNQTFPVTLYRILEDMEKENVQQQQPSAATVAGRTIIGWIENGKGFKVHEPEVFNEYILPKYSKGGRKTRYRSFQRQLNIYGFKMNKDGIYCRNNFFRGCDLETIKRNIRPVPNKKTGIVKNKSSRMKRTSEQKKNKSAETAKSGGKLATPPRSSSSSSLSPSSSKQSRKKKKLLSSSLNSFIEPISSDDSLIVSKSCSFSDDDTNTKRSTDDTMMQDNNVQANDDCASYVVIAPSSSHDDDVDLEILFEDLNDDFVECKCQGRSVHCRCFNDDSNMDFNDMFY